MFYTNFSKLRIVHLLFCPLAPLSPILAIPAAYIFVRLPKADVNYFKDCAIVEGDEVITIPSKSSNTKCKVRLPIAGKSNIWLSCRPHAVEFGFSITVHKLQVQT